MGRNHDTDWDWRPTYYCCFLLRNIRSFKRHQKRNENARLLNIALARAIQFRNTPYFLIGDINVDPATSISIKTCVTLGLITDVARDRAHDNEDVQSTFCRQGVTIGMSGPGTTRIDVILSNRCGGSCIENLEYLWKESTGYDHVMMAVTLSMDAFSAKALQLTKPIKINLDDILELLKQKKLNDLEHLLRNHWSLYAAAFDDYINNKDINGAHRIWCLAMETFLLKFNNHDCSAQVGSKFPARGSDLPLEHKDLIPSFSNSNDHNDGKASQDITRMLAQTRELIRKLTLWQSHANDNGTGMRQGPPLMLPQPSPPTPTENRVFDTTVGNLHKLLHKHLPE